VGDADLYALIQNMDPAALQQMMEAGVVPEQLALQAQQAKRGQGLADTQTPQGMHVGGSYVASSPLEHLAAALRQGQGGIMQNKAAQAQQDALKQAVGGRTAYLQGIAGQGPQQQTPPASGTGGEF
jgi:hypothetical protein